MIYFLHGENDFAIQQQVGVLKSDFSNKYGEDAITKIDCQDIDPQQLVAELVNISMFNSTRLVIISDIDRNGQAWALVGENLDRIPSDTHVIIIAKSPDRRTMAYKALLKSAKSQEFKYLKGRELADWLMTELQTRKIDFKRSAIDDLIVATSGDQWRLVSEISKLELLDRVIDTDLIRQFVEPDLDSNAFIILDYAMSGNRETALEELSKLKQIEDPNKFFGLLSSQFFALTAAVFGSEQSQIANDLKIHPFQLSKMADLARKFGDNTQQRHRVVKASEVLSKMDAKIKLSRPDEAWSLVEIAISTM